jgi:signal transduction histidine kinase
VWPVVVVKSARGALDYPRPGELARQVAHRPCCSEALTNTTKHARASHAHIIAERRDTLLYLSICDDGGGGADPTGGSGLIGLRDRVQALGGSIEVNSPPGDGTAIVVELPLQPD